MRRSEDKESDEGQEGRVAEGTDQKVEPGKQEEFPTHGECRNDHSKGTWECNEEWGRIEGSEDKDGHTCTAGQ